MNLARGEKFLTTRLEPRVTGHARVYSKYGRGILLGILSPESKNSETSQVVFSS
jgi:hypothetical protein